MGYAPMVVEKYFFFSDKIGKSEHWLKEKIHIISSIPSML